MGRKQFETVVASAPRERLIMLKQYVSTSVPAGAESVVRFYANPNTICHVLGMRHFVQGVPGATGNHSLSIGYENASDLISKLIGTSTGATPIAFQYSQWDSATVSYSPEKSAQGVAEEKLYFDSVSPLVMTYSNNTNVANPFQRGFFVMAIEKMLG